MRPGARDFQDQGYLLIERLVPDSWVERAIAMCEPHLLGDDNRRPGVRRIVESSPGLAGLIEDSSIPELAASIAGPGVRIVRSILFDKGPGANWAVPWHQDAVIAVRERMEVPGFGPWSIKGGEPHCRPPREVMDSILVVRIHLDACGPDNGPLRLVAGSDRFGVLPEGDVDAVVRGGPFVECCTGRGGAVVLRPHTVHSSKRSVAQGRRRVLHLEYSNMELPGGLLWAEGVNRSRTVSAHG